MTKKYRIIVPLFLISFILLTMLGIKTVHAQGVPPAGNIVIFCKLQLFAACQPPRYTISGNVFVDANKNGIVDGGDSNYLASPSISINPSGGTITPNANGTYTISNLLAGTYTVSYGGPPSGYIMTSPLTNPPPSFSVTVGNPGCTVGAPGAVCTAGNITNLNFGISNNFPWFQSNCGDVRDDDGIVDNLPSGQRLITQASPCGTAGLAYTGNINASLGNGISTFTVGGSNYPELYPSSYSPLSTSYPSLLAKTTNAGITPTDVTTAPISCNLSGCTLPANITHGIYIANNSIILNSFTAPAGQDYIFLVNGDLTINGPVSIPVGSTVLFSASGNIIVNSNVGTATLTSTTSNLDGWYVAGGSFIINSAGGCNDLRLNIAGSVVINALGGSGTFTNKRDLCGNDANDPAVFFAQRLDFILNAPQFLQQQVTLSREVSP